MTNTKYKAAVNQHYNYEISAEEALALDAVKADSELFHVISQHQSKAIHIVKADYAKKTFSFSIQNKIYEVQVKDAYDILLDQMGMNKASNAKLNNLKAPMPGLVLKVMVAEGEKITKGSPLLILEAMKMENVLKCPADVEVKTIKVKQGDAVDKNQVLIEFA